MTAKAAKPRPKREAAEKAPVQKAAPAKSAAAFYTGAFFEAAPRGFAPALAGGADLDAGFLEGFAAACLADGRAGLLDLLLELEDLAGAAFRTGGFAAAARFGLGFAASAVNL